MRRFNPAVLVVTSGALYLMACSAGAPTAPSIAGPASPSTAPAVTAHTGSGDPDAGALSADAQRQIAQLRQLMAPFHNFSKAVEFGYSIPAPGPGVCLSDPARGGMGYHYAFANKDLINDGAVNLLEPEFIVYSPTATGGLRLSAADYFIPYSTWHHAEPPSLLGVSFEREDAFQAYVLHIWAFWPNPAGIFANFNPDVPLCPE